MKKRTPRWVRMLSFAVMVPVIWAAFLIVVWHILLGPMTAKFWQPILALSCLHFVFTFYMYLREVMSVPFIRSTKMYAIAVAFYLLTFGLILIYYGHKLLLVSNEI